MNKAPLKTQLITLFWKQNSHHKPEDIINNKYSFTDHEEISYQMIKDWPFISDYTKNLVRYHYLIRRISKAKENNLWI